MNPTDDQKLELLYNHYCDTYAVIQQLIKSRDRFFISILVLLGVMSFQVALPTESGSVIAEFARARLGIHSTLSISFLGSVIWAALLFVVVRYFQIAVYLERQYRYIHALEAELSPFYSGIPFTREGAFYLANYPWFSAWAPDIQARLERQSILYEASKRFDFIITEAALRWSPPGVNLKAQLSYVSSMQTLPNVSIRMLPTGAPSPPVLHPFVIWHLEDEALVSVETYSAALWVREAADIERYRAVWSQFAEAAQEMT